MLTRSQKRLRCDLRGDSSGLVSSLGRYRGFSGCSAPAVSVRQAAISPLKRGMNHVPNSLIYRCVTRKVVVQLLQYLQPYTSRWVAHIVRSCCGIRAVHSVRHIMQEKLRQPGAESSCPSP